MRIASSYKDPSGFVFSKNKIIYREINHSYYENYQMLMENGLYGDLIERKLLIPHEEISKTNSKIIIKPKYIPFISYPYEWSFDQLKDAAFLTLKIQNIAMQYNMIIKDASPYNIQFLDGNPVFIDTLSFEKYKNNQPWVAYKQFCELFLCPLLLMVHTDINLQNLLKNYIDGLPIKLTSKLLPKKTYLNLNILLHIHLHSLSQTKYSSTKITKIDDNKVKIRKQKLLNIINNLTSFTKSINFKEKIMTEWGEYYLDTNYTDKEITTKRIAIRSFLKKIKIKSLWDFGGNNGYFSRESSNLSINTICLDIDPIAVNENYLFSKKQKDKYMLPLLFDLTNPSPDIGWDNNERLNISKRGSPDCVMALALIHHLVFSKNIPLFYIFNFLHMNTKKYLIIEYIDIEDKQALRLLRSKSGNFHKYSYETFKIELEKKFKILHAKKIINSKRILFFATKI